MAIFFSGASDDLINQVLTKKCAYSRNKALFLCSAAAANRKYAYCCTVKINNGVSNNAGVLSSIFVHMRDMMDIVVA